MKNKVTITFETESLTLTNEFVKMIKEVLNDVKQENKITGFSIKKEINIYNVNTRNGLHGIVKNQQK